MIYFTVVYCSLCMRSGKREKFRKNILGLKYIFLFALGNGLLRSEKEKGYKLLFMHDYALSTIPCYSTIHSSIDFGLGASFLR